jgi:hypothetical protein
MAVPKKIMNKHFKIDKIITPVKRIMNYEHLDLLLNIP